MPVSRNNRKVFTIGEALLDIVFEDNKPVNAVPGGSMLNAAVSLGRMGININFITELGLDPVGDQIRAFLTENHVNSDHCILHQAHPTSIALAFLDASKKASYSFYHQVPEKVNDIELPEFNENDILLFGSFYALNPARRNVVKPLAEEANKRGAIVIYDPNFRKRHHQDSGDVISIISENIRNANILKGSDEDFDSIYGTHDITSVYERVKTLCSCLIITSGDKEVEIMTPYISASFQVPKLHPVSTIGAGDNFNAGLIYGLISNEINTADLSKMNQSAWESVIRYGISFAAATCMSIDNYISVGFNPD